MIIPQILQSQFDSFSGSKTIGQMVIIKKESKSIFTPFGFQCAILYAHGSNIIFRYMIFSSSVLLLGGLKIDLSKF